MATKRKAGRLSQIQRDTTTTNSFNDLLKNVYSLPKPSLFDHIKGATLLCQQQLSAAHAAGNAGGVDAWTDVCDALHAIDLAIIKARST